jgi:hypothetical protein
MWLQFFRALVAATNNKLVGLARGRGISVTRLFYLEMYAVLLLVVILTGTIVVHYCAVAGTSTNFYVQIQYLEQQGIMDVWNTNNNSLPALPVLHLLN